MKNDIQIKQRSIWQLNAIFKGYLKYYFINRLVTIKTWLTAIILKINGNIYLHLTYFCNI